MVALITAFALTAGSALAGQDEAREARARDEQRRETRQRAAEILTTVGAVPGARVADVGAGDGFYTVRLARAVGPGGRVIAEDVDAKALDRLRARLREESLTNVEVVLGEPGDPRLPEAALDAVLIVNAYHEMVDFPAMLEHVRRALKPDGRLVLVEPFDPRLRGQDRAKQTKAHSLAPSFAEQELRAAGFDVTGLQDPFVRGDPDEQWLMVAQPAPSAALPGRPTGPEAVGARAPLAADEPDEAELASPALRISQQEFATLYAGGKVLILDVRGSEAYGEGHIPGARHVPLGEIGAQVGALAREGRPIVAYCT